MAVKVTSAAFVACVTSPGEMPTGKPVIALVGRSNVGKSSLLNVLACRKELAKTSSTPGKTLTINFYEFNEEFYLVDLPGYGYAKASKVTRERIQGMMDEFFGHTREIVGIIQVLDVRHAPSPLDVQMYQWIGDQDLKHLLVLTKSDKLGSTELAKMKKLILKKLQINGAMLFSGKTRQGREELLSCIAGLVSSHKEPKVERAPGEGAKSNRRRRNKSGKGSSDPAKKQDVRIQKPEPVKEKSPEKNPQEKTVSNAPNDGGGKARKRNRSRNNRRNAPRNPSPKNPKPKEG